MTNQPPSAGLELWKQVETTDPSFTKTFTSSTGFKGTAISPLYLARKATDVFGPFGLGWEIDIVEGTERYKEGAPIAYNSNGDVAIRTVVHSARFELWYILNGQKGTVKQYGSTTFIGRRADGEIYTNDDAEKMSQTDAMSKCLSLLGFGGDVHLGKFDDAKYVAGLEAAIESGALTGVNLQPAGNVQQGSSEGNGSSAQASGGASAQEGSQLSKRYHKYRDRMKKGAVEDIKASREVISQDPALSDMEKALLLSSPELKLDERLVGSQPATDDQVLL